MHDQLLDLRTEASAQVRARARSLAAFYASGALLNIASSAAPGWTPASRAGLLGIAALALVTALGLVVAGGRAGRATCHLLLGVGSGLIGGCMVSAGSSPMVLAYAFFFCWVSVYAANWWSPRALVVHLGIALGCEAVAITAVGLGRLALPACLVTMGACAAAGFVVRSLRDQVRELALRDPLTGALNRRGLGEVLVELSRGQRSWTAVALDLDGFKAYNDSRGHAEGDAALRACVEGWTALLRRGEAVARLGGDEFVLVCTRPPGELATLIGQARACAPEGLAVSAGTATVRPEEPAGSVLARADAALYLDKAVPVPRRQLDRVRPADPVVTTRRPSVAWRS